MGLAKLRGSIATLVALAAGAGAAALVGCGSQTKTVTVGSSPAPSSSSTQQTATTQTRATRTQSSTGARSSSPSSTRTASEPAFTEREKSGSETAGAASAAAAIVRAHGYTPNDTSQYHPNQTLRVLVATRTGSGDGYAQQAFFFIDGRYIGTDTKDPSAGIRVVSQSDTAVTLAYPLYRSSDPLCCPSGGQATVRYELNNGKLEPAGTIPPASSSSTLSRH
jgi:LppP/LprE lipoprotein